MMTTTIRRTALSLAGLALVAGGLTGCGDDQASDTSGDKAGGDTGSSSGGDGASAPDDISTADFCGSYADLIKESASSFTGDATAAELVPTLKKFAAQLSEIGTPSDIPADARRGFELSVDAINDLPDDATQEDLLGASEKYSEEETADAQAFSTYVQKACPDVMKELAPSGAATDGAG